MDPTELHKKQHREVEALLKKIEKAKPEQEEEMFEMAEVERAKGRAA